jgi:uncharacterized protein (DUF362 family)
MPKSYTVRAAYCHYQSTDEEVYRSLRRITDPLERSWENLQKAKRIAIKFNQDWDPARLVTHLGHRQQLVSNVVARAVLRLLKERTSAELFVIDVGVEGAAPGQNREWCSQVLPVLREFGVPYVDGHVDAVEWVTVPGGGQMFERYAIPRSANQADAVVSVQKIKNHAYMGVTLCLKNLFGVMPLEPLGRPRGYYHHLVRMPYMLADIGRIFKPALNILDGLVTQAGQEWGRGDHPRVCNTLVAGDHVIATDACAAHLMGHDPESDWLTPPFHRDRNALLTAAQGGFGTVNLDEIDFESEVTAPIGQFFSMEFDTRERVISWRRTTAEQALYYRDHQAEFLEQYANQYILLQMNEVRFSSASGRLHFSRRQLSGANPEQAMWLKYVDPKEDEREHFEVYERTLEECRVPA